MSKLAKDVLRPIGIFISIIVSLAIVFHFWEWDKILQLLFTIISLTPLLFLVAIPLSLIGGAYVLIKELALKDHRHHGDHH